MYSFQASIGSRAYQVHKDTKWKPIYVNQLIAVSREINATLMQHSPYCCRITRHKIGPVTVGHIPHELLQFVFSFLQEGDTVSGTVVDTKHQESLIPEEGLEIPCLLNFIHHCKKNIKKDERICQKAVVKI